MELCFQPGQALRNKHHGSIIRVLRVKPSESLNYEIMTNYFFTSFSNAISDLNYEPISFVEWCKATLPHLTTQLRRRHEQKKPIVLWLLNTIRKTYLPRWRLLF